MVLVMDWSRDKFFKIKGQPDKTFRIEGYGPVQGVIAREYLGTVDGQTMTARKPWNLSIDQFLAMEPIEVDRAGSTVSGAVGVGDIPIPPVAETSTTELPQTTGPKEGTSTMTTIVTNKPSDKHPVLHLKGTDLEGKIVGPTDPEKQFRYVLWVKADVAQGYLTVIGRGTILKDAKVNCAGFRKLQAWDGEKLYTVEPNVTEGKLQLPEQVEVLHYQRFEDSYNKKMILELLKSPLPALDVHEAPAVVEDTGTASEAVAA